MTSNARILRPFSLSYILSEFTNPLPCRRVYTSARNFEEHGLSCEQWKSALHLSTRWEFVSLRKLVLNLIRPPTAFDRLLARSLPGRRPRVTTTSDFASWRIFGHSSPLTVSFYFLFCSIYFLFVCRSAGLDLNCTIRFSYRTVAYVKNTFGVFASASETCQFRDPGGPCVPVSIRVRKSSPRSPSLGRDG